MSKETKIEISLLLPQGNGCEPCLERLQKRIQDYRGIEVAHLEQEHEPPHICIHYDPNLVTVDYVRALAVEEGAHLEWRYRHETLSVTGLDCADCARTLENGIERLAGVLWVSANFAASTMAVEYDADRVARSAILSRVRALGYDVQEPAEFDGRGESAPEMVFQVDGMDCADCALHLEEALRNTPGIAEVSVDFALARLRLTPEDGREVQGSIEQVAQSMGYSVVAEAGWGAEAEPTGWRQRLWRRRRDLTTVVSGLLIALAVAMSLFGLPEAAVAAVYVAAIIVGGYYIARSGWAALRTAHSLDMNALMTIAAVGAVFVGEWAEGAVAMFLFSLGNTLEGYTMDRARNAIRSLMDLSPRRATVLHGNQEEQVRVEELRVGDRILVRPGERIPMDGLLLTGESAVNQAPITGESIPVDKAPGQE
ncbi:MAG: cation transporter, partial [Anaerolineae bacterium]